VGPRAGLDVYEKSRPHRDIFNFFKLPTIIYMVYKFNVHHTVLSYIAIKAVCNVSTETASVV
jgi:hypothetical protein